MPAKSHHQDTKTPRHNKINQKLSHVDGRGNAQMVDVSEKPPTARRAMAESYVALSRKTMALISSGGLPKGDALETARLAGIVAAKRTPDLIPLCHPLNLTHIDVHAEATGGGVRFVATVACNGPTGVEMEALTAASVAALTLYDMIKAVEKGAVIRRICLLEKTGGKSGTFRRHQRRLES
jgi:cyclic pyranopterin phosphate synthase